MKRFYSSSVEEAMNAARAQLGQQAVVLSTDLVSSPGWRGWMGQRLVAVTAAVERQWSAVRPQASSDRQSADAAAARAGVAARLAATGLDSASADRVAARMSVAECRTRAESAMHRELAGELAGMVGTDKRLAPIEVFIGPPGVGKTTTIAKLAAGRRAAGARPPSLVAADGFRAGAVEHLRVYASIIGAPFRVARGPDELDRALVASPGAALVDTAGRPPSDEAFRDMWRVVGGRRGVRTHLVMAADTSVAMARRVLDSYAAAAPERVVITKLDEAETVAPLLAVLRERQLSISYLAYGQRIPEDLMTATADGLAHALLGTAQWEGTCH